MRDTLPPVELSPLLVATAWSVSIEIGMLFVVAPAHTKISGKKASHVFFNAQDWFASDTAKDLQVKFPKQSETATFAPFVEQYIGIVKVIIGLAAASISFGGLQVTSSSIYTAKLLLAYSIAFAVVFSVTMVNFYENYLHDLASYKPWKAIFVESCGLSSLFTFALGYWYWARHL
jgi:hypothetical protein